MAGTLAQMMETFQRGVMTLERLRELDALMQRIAQP